jgi:hypothetical protein
MMDRWPRACFTSAKFTLPATRRDARLRLTQCGCSQTTSPRRTSVRERHAYSTHGVIVAEPNLGREVGRSVAVRLSVEVDRQQRSRHRVTERPSADAEQGNGRWRSFLWVRLLGRFAPWFQSPHDGRGPFGGGKPL